MVPSTRRRLLRGVAAGLLGVLAGCSGPSTSSVGASADDSDPGERQPENVARDPDRVSLRNTGGESEPAAWLADPYESAAVDGDGDDDGDDGDDDASNPRDRGREHGFVASAETAARVRFADGVDGADAARSFLDATDYGTETIYLEQRPVRECLRMELCYVTWSATEIETQYGGYYRDADVACEVDARDVVAWLVRIPDALDPDSVTSHGSGWSSGGCHYPPPLREDREEREERQSDRPMVGPPPDSDPNGTARTAGANGTATTSTAAANGTAATSGTATTETPGEGQ